MKNIAVIRAEYYDDVMKGLLDDFYKYAQENNLDYDFKEFYVAGSMELPLAVKLLMEKGDFDGFAVFGCVIEGETFHNQVIQNNVYQSINQLSLDYSKPVGFGVLTVKTMSQAIERSIGLKSRGHEAMAALESLFGVIDKA